jgi:hypothetical protein
LVCGHAAFQTFSPSRFTALARSVVGIKFALSVRTSHLLTASEDWLRHSTRGTGQMTYTSPVAAKASAGGAFVGHRP